MPIQPNVLIVDDDPKILQTLYRYTESLGFHTVAVGTLREALTRLSEFDILILDETVNGGKISTDMLMEKWVGCGHNPVCVLTDDLSLEHRRILLQNGAYNVLVKPLSMETYSTLLPRYKNVVYYKQRCVELEKEMSDQLDDFKKKEMPKIQLKFWIVVIVAVISIITGQVDIPELLNLF